MILQFGAGNFLRAFADLFLTESGREPGCATVVQSTGRERADAINAAAGRYHVAIQGFRDGEVVDDLVSVNSLGAALHAGTQWGEIRDIGRRPDLEAVLSNTTEAGDSITESVTSRPLSAGRQCRNNVSLPVLSMRASLIWNPWKCF